MRLKIRCDGESKKFCKIFEELNKALACHYIHLVEYVLNSVAHYKDRLLTSLCSVKSGPLVYGLVVTWGAGGLPPRGMLHIPRLGFLYTQRCNSTLDNSEECLLAGARDFSLSYWKGFPC